MFDLAGDRKKLKEINEMAFIDRNPKPGAHCKDFKPRTYDNKLCDRSDDCRWEKQGYEKRGALGKCSGIFSEPKIRILPKGDPLLENK